MTVYGISPYLKLGLRDYTCSEIGITGLQDPPPMGALKMVLETMNTTKYLGVQPVRIIEIDP